MGWLKKYQNGGNGYNMGRYQQGVDFQPKSISQNGGVVKDDNGYWNPDNHGKVVEIDSNIITMENVDQPLLGISDSGDTKMMYPGNNYEFKGNKVREYPVVPDEGSWKSKHQNGGNLPTKLDQLTNFTNYNTPQKGGWLDKY